MRKLVLFAVACLVFPGQPRYTAWPSPACPQQWCSANPVFQRLTRLAPSPQQLAAIFPGRSVGGCRPTSRRPGRAFHPPAGSSLRLCFSGRGLARNQAVSRSRRQSSGSRRHAVHSRRLPRSGGWHLRDYSVRFIRPLMIDQYQETPGSERTAVPAQSRAALAASRFRLEAGLQPGDPAQRGGSLPPRRRRRFDRRAPRLSRLGHAEWTQTFGAGHPGRSLPKRLRRRTLDFRECRTLPRVLRQRSTGAIPCWSGHCRARRNSPCARRCRSTFRASP